MSAISDRIERELVEEAGIHAAVEDRDGEIVLTGLISSENERQAAMDIATVLAPESSVVDNLEIATVLPGEIGDLELSDTNVGDFPAATPGTEDNSPLEPGDFMSQHTNTNPMNAAGPTGAASDEEISEGDDVYIPPIDPTRTRDNEILNGFEISSMDSIEVARSALDGRPGDLAIREAVERELSEDAATNDLTIRVAVRGGVVRLRGRVPSITDAENAEEVASRVPGVIEVLEELDVPELG